MNGSEILTEVSKSTNSEIVLLAIVVAVVACILAIPLYRMFSNKDLNKLQKYTEREGQILQVVQQNTTAITKLTTILETNNKNCIDCKNEQVDIWKDVDSKMDKVLVILERSA